MELIGRAAAARLPEKESAPEGGRGASTRGNVQREQDRTGVANFGLPANINPSTDYLFNTARKRAAHAMEARLQGERLLRWMEKSPELRASIALAARKDRERQRALSADVFMAILRLSEVGRVLRDRYGGEDFQLPDDDAGMDDAVILANSLACLSRGRAERIVGRLLHHAPWMSEARAMQIACRAIASPTIYKADTLAQRLGVNDATRTRLDLRTIGATDVDAEARKARRKVKDAEAARAARAASGSKTRDEYEADAQFKRDLCAALNISPRTYYVRRKKGALPQPEEQAKLVAQVRRQYIAVGDSYRSDALVQSDAVGQDASTEQGRGLDAAPDQASAQTVQQAPRNRDSGFVPSQRASDAPSRVPLQTVQPAHRPISGLKPATPNHGGTHV